MAAEQEYPETPAGYAARWESEIKTAKKLCKPWWERADKIVGRYVDDRKDGSTETRLNLFTANTQTMSALLYGKTPQVDVSRRFADSEDDQARVAAEMLERLLNTDIEKDSDTATEAFRQALEDRLVPGMGNVRLRYDMQEMDAPGFVPQQGEDPPQVKDPSTECVYVDYLYWKDQLWSPCRTFHQLRWWAFGNEMSEDDFIARFGEEQRKAFQDRKRSDESASSEGDATSYKDELARCCVWEIWSKERKTVDWFMEGYPETLDHKDDPYGLENFWPFPRPMMANLTTSKFLPTPDYVLAQDLYEGIDTLETRIGLLEDAIRVAGLFDKTNEEVKRLIQEKGTNQLYPVDAWGAFAEKGGIKGAIDWLPLEVIVGALDRLRDCRTEKIGLLFQVTGMSDIMRGQASQQTTATEQAIKARFASVRVQSMQDEFARFCSDTQKIKAELIAKLFEPETIIERSNVLRTPDAQLAQPAVQLIKDRFSEYRISVNPDNIALQDFAALKQERFEYANARSAYWQGQLPFLQLMMPIPKAFVASVRFSLNESKALLAGLKGSSELEGIYDAFIGELEQIAAETEANPPQPPPNPQLQVAQVKAGAEQFKAKADVMKTGLDLHVAQQKHSMEMQKMQADQQMAAQDHNRSMQSQEGQERLAAIKQVDKVTGGTQ